MVDFHKKLQKDGDARIQRGLLRIRWVGIHFRGSSNFILAEKLQVLKPLLNSKHKEVFCHGILGKGSALDFEGAEC